MPVHNADIAAILNKVADLLDIEGANQFRIRAYRNAARTIAGLPQRVIDLVAQEEDLSKLPDIGQDLAKKIKEIARTGDLQMLHELEDRTSPELSDLMKIEGLGPKRIGILHRELGIRGFKDLQEAADQSKIEDLPGFGEKLRQKIVNEIKRLKGKERQRLKLIAAEEIVQALIDYLKKAKDIKKIIVAGSYRRCKETVGDLDILITCKRGDQIMDCLVNYEDVTKVISKGKTRSTVVLRSGLHVDVRVVPQASYGAALHYFTGSKAHNIAVRKIGVKKGLKINEYGIFKGKKKIAGRKEEEVFKQVGLAYIQPELRENRGEIEAAAEGRLPQLVNLSDIRGDLHTHTNDTDGHHSLKEMARAAKEHGYEYLAITDHSQRVSIARGLNVKRLTAQVKKIDHLNAQLDGIIILKAIEVDILEDGSLDLPDDILKELDLRVEAVHYKFNLSRKKQTERIIKAMDNPYFNILAHPTGRLINDREPYKLDVEKVMVAALERGCFLELNACPDRLDLNDIHCKLAKDLGLKVAVSTDAHSISNLDFMRFGIGQARRGWLEPYDILNTRSWLQLKKLLQRL
jgi:DNA polymerase (family 10)